MTAAAEPVRAVVLSGHGTVFDSAAAVRAAAASLDGKADALAALWQAKRFEYAWIATATGRRAELWQISGEALDHAMGALGFGHDRLLRARLMQGLLQAPPFPDARPALAALAGNRMRPLALLTNASSMMVTAIAKAGEVFGLFDALISAEPTGVFKPNPAVYHLASARFGVVPSDILYVSAHAWDVAGAALSGMRAVWLNRDRALPEFAWAPPTTVVETLAALPDLLEAGLLEAGAAGGVTTDREVLPGEAGAVRRRVRVRGGLTVSVLVWGAETARTPLLCLPGLVRTGGDFGGLARRHGARRLVVAPDYPGRGASDRALLWRRYLPERTLKDVIDVCTSFRLSRVVAVGTSLGAVLAMGLATVRPRLVSAALLNDAGPVLDQRGLGFVRGFVGRDHPQASLADASAFLRRTLPWLSLTHDAEWCEMARLTFAEGEDGLWHVNWDTRIARTLDRSMPGDLWDLFAPLSRLPALLVRGGISDVLSAETAAEMRRRFPRLAYAELPGVGHAPTLSEPGLAETVDAFLEAQA